MAMKMYMPGKSEAKDAFVVAVLLIVLSYVKSYVSGFLGNITGNFGEFAGIVNGIVVGIVAGVLLTLVGQRRYAAMAFALALGVELAAYAQSKLNV